jgi:hypothetical protein
LVLGIGRFYGLAGKVSRRLVKKKNFTQIKGKNHADLKEKERRFSFLWIGNKTGQKIIAS